MVKPFINFTTRDLITIGLFAASAKAVSLLVALMGGGMNPVTLILKNAVWTMLYIVLLVKVDKIGTLTLANLISSILGLFLMGQHVLSLPFVIVACVISELLMLIFKRVFSKVVSYGLGIAICELLSKVCSVFLSYIAMREQPAMLIPMIVIVCIGYVGVIAGVFGGRKMVEELRHAGLIQH